MHYEEPSDPQSSTSSLPTRRSTDLPPTLLTYSSDSIRKEGRKRWRSRIPQQQTLEGQVCMSFWSCSPRTSRTTRPKLLYALPMSALFLQTADSIPLSLDLATRTSPYPRLKVLPPHPSTLSSPLHFRRPLPIPSQPRAILPHSIDETSLPRPLSI